LKNLWNGKTAIDFRYKHNTSFPSAVLFVRMRKLVVCVLSHEATFCILKDPAGGCPQI